MTLHLPHDPLTRVMEFLSGEIECQGYYTEGTEVVLGKKRVVLVLSDAAGTRWSIPPPSLARVCTVWKTAWEEHLQCVARCEMPRAWPPWASFSTPEALKCIYIYARCNNDLRSWGDNGFISHKQEVLEGKTAGTADLWQLWLESWVPANDWDHPYIVMERCGQRRLVN